MARRSRTVQEQADSAETIGRRVGLDLYHFLLRAPWAQVLLAYAALYLTANLVFAFGYLAIGGVANARDGSLGDAFWFSVQMLGGIDGSMSAVTPAARALVTVESMAGTLLIAMVAGMAFAKVSVPRAKVRFSNHAVLFLFDGQPTLAFRLGNERRDLVAGVDVAVLAFHPTHTVEGHMFWRSLDLKLRRSHIPALSRGWMVLHTIDEGSPLHGLTPERFAAESWELNVSLMGTDSLSGQAVNATHMFEAPDLRWGHRFVDIYSTNPVGPSRVDLRFFDETVPCEPTPAFPYPRAPGGA